MKLLVLSDQNNKDIQFIITKDKEKEQTFTFQELELVEVWYFCLNDLLVIKIVA